MKEKKNTEYSGKNKVTTDSFFQGSMFTYIMTVVWYLKKILDVKYRQPLHHVPKTQIKPTIICTPQLSAFSKSYIFLEG